jgi:hypothetical protein
LSGTGPALLNFGIQVIQELIGFTRDAKLSPSRGFEMRSIALVSRLLRLLSKLPVLDKGL